jgi:hypothetical protein
VGIERYATKPQSTQAAQNPPLLTFTIQRPGGTVLGSTTATLQEWTVNVEKKIVHCVEARSKQLRPMQPRLEVRLLAEEVAALIVNRRED